MPGSSKLPTSITKITAADTKPKTDSELRVMFNKLANALLGDWGSGSFDGGVGGNGYYNKRGYFWDFVLDFTANGSVSITLPFIVYERSAIEVIRENGSIDLSFIEDSRSVQITATGRTLVRGNMILVGK